MDKAKMVVSSANYPQESKGHAGQKSDPDQDEENLLLILLVTNFWIPGMILLDNFKL